MLLLSQIDSVRDQVAAVEERLSIMRETILSILEAPYGPELRFRDEDLSVSWRYGRFQFPKGSLAPYRMLQALHEAGPEGLSHAELAEKVYGDVLADVVRCADRLAKKLEKFGCPKRLERDSHRVWLENAR